MDSLPQGWPPAGVQGASVIDALVDQHTAVALESLSMDQGSTYSSYPAHYANDSDDASLSPNEDYLNTLNKDRFLSITAFYRSYLKRKDDLGALEDLPIAPVVTRDQLRGDECDMQGINWALRRTTRSAVRKKRIAFEEARLNPAVKAVRQNMVRTPNTESYFSFKRNDAVHQASVPHFQLRNLMAATSRHSIFYADRDVVMRTDSESTPANVVMDLTKEHTEAGKFQITTLAASDEVLIVGGFEGEYAFTGLSANRSTAQTIGRIKDRSPGIKSHITNHIHLTPSRTSYTPQAILSSNDNRLRILDVNTNTFTHSFGYSQAVNCSATSPNGRMRVVVGDFRETYITNAETGQAFETLKTHTDDAFACDWADDGIHVATAAQDSTICVWDARNWNQPLAVMYSELSVPRCLKFSPVGGGPRVLVSAEADDYLNIINAQTFASKQTFDFFGRTGGISMTPDGSSLFLANSEPHFGGIMEFERCGWAEQKYDRSKRDSGSGWLADWDSDGGLDADERTVTSKNERRRRGVDLSGITL
jgi:DNA-binding beta-propeller fold protein YncE